MRGNSDEKDSEVTVINFFCYIYARYEKDTDDHSAGPDSDGFACRTD